MWNLCTRNFLCTLRNYSLTYVVISVKVSTNNSILDSRVTGGNGVSKTVKDSRDCYDCYDCYDSNLQSYNYMYEETKPTA